MNIAVASFTGAGDALGARLAGMLRERGHETVHTSLRGGGIPLGQWTERAFREAEALVFVGAVGIAVRAVAPHLRNKAVDPAVVCVDEAARFAVPLVSGHIGGAVALARLLADLTGAAPVVTTATDLRGVFAVDSWAVGQGLRIRGPEGIKLVSARLLEGGDVPLWSDFPIAGNPPAGIRLVAGGDCRVRITCRAGDFGEALVLTPPAVTVGMGCRKNTPAAHLAAALDGALVEAGIHPWAVGRICSVDLKAEEPGLLALCRERGLPARFFSAGELRAVPGNFHASRFVEETAGVDNVCERCAVLGSGGELILPRRAGNGVTVALAAGPWPLRFEENLEEDNRWER